MANNYISLHGCVNKNGRPVDFVNNPLNEDAMATQLVYVQLSKCLNAQGVLVNAFMLTFQTVGLKSLVVYLYTYTGFSTIQQFLNGLATLGVSDNFTQYVNLLTIDAVAPQVANQSILFNDRYTTAGGRYYMNNNTTQVKIKWAQKLSPIKFVFNGNQTSAGSYVYFYV